MYIAEKAGKPAHLMAVPGKDVYALILLAAHRLRSSRAVMSLSENAGAEEQERQIARAWDNLPRPRPELCVEIMPDGEEAPWKSSWGGTWFYPPPRTRTSRTAFCGNCPSAILD